MRLLALALLLLAGCATRTVLEPVPVKVPVMVYCAVDFPAEPDRPTSRLTEGSDIFEITKALWAELIELRAYTGVVKASAAGCQQPKKGDAK